MRDVCAITCPGCAATGTVRAYADELCAGQYAKAKEITRYSVAWDMGAKRWFSRNLTRRDLDDDFDCGCGTVPDAVTKRREMQARREAWNERKRDNESRASRLARLERPGAF